MPKYTVTRYLLIESEVEADTPEDALRIEEGLQIVGDLDSPDALGFSWSYSDAMGEWVCDESGEVVFENY